MRELSTVDSNRALSHSRAHFAFHFEAFSSGGLVPAMEATQFTTQHNRFKTRRNGLSIDCVVDSVVDSLVD